MSTNARNIEQIKGNADIGRFRFKAGNDWVGGTYNRAIVKEFYGALQERSRHERRGCVKENPHGAQQVHSVSKRPRCRFGPPMLLEERFRTVR